MLVAEELCLALGKTLQSIVELAGLATAVLPAHVPRKESSDEEDARRGSNVDGVTRDIAVGLQDDQRGQHSFRNASTDLGANWVVYVQVETTLPIV